MEEEMKKSIKVEVDLNPDAGGIAIILCNNYIGVNSKKGPLYGSKKDASEMDSTFEHIKFARIKIENATRDNIISLIQAVAQYKFPDSYKSVVVIFSGHGNGKPAIISSDDLDIDLNEEIIKPLETLEGKNKIALIAACQDKREEAKPLIVYDKGLVGFSTRYGTQAADADNGCPWMQRLAKEIKKMSLSIDKILIKVNKEVKEITGQDPQYKNTTVDICLGLEASQEQRVRITADGPEEIMSATQYTAETVMERDVKLSQLNSITWTIGGRLQQLNLKEQMSPKWLTLGQNLNISNAKLKGYKAHHLHNNEDCMDSVFDDWYEIKSKKYPPTWEGLEKWLRSVVLNSSAEKILEAAKDPKSTLYEED